MLPHNVRYNRVRGYSRKYTIRYIPRTRNKHRNTQCDYIKIFILGFIFISNYKYFLMRRYLSKFRTVHSQILPVISKIRYNEG
jgi:hypothetical protein